MQTIFATVILFALVMLAMAVGTILTGRSLKGSCGGVAGAGCPCSDEERQACPKRSEAPS